MTTADELREATSLIEEGRHTEALHKLGPTADPGASRGDASNGGGGERRALLGLAHFHLQEYAVAQAEYEAALKLAPENVAWRHMERLARANSIAEAQVAVPPITFFERDRLLAPSRIAPGTLPAPISLPSPGLLTRLRRFIGHKLGVIATLNMNLLTKIVGLFGYRGKVWTKWYHRPLNLDVLTLAHMRERLNEHSLKSTYPRGELIGFQARNQAPPPGVTHFRTADGSWNNLQNPKEGAAGTRFLRNVSDDASCPEIGESLMTPNPREISRRLLTRGEEMKEVPFLNLLAASWIQFQNHDWVNHGENLLDETIEIPLAEDDPAREQYRQTSIRVGRTQPDPTRMTQGERTPITFINEVTHWWDGSQLYGSDQETVDRLRSHVDGKLRLADGKDTLPLDDDGIEETGFTRNWWVGLAMLHTLFAREHNAICEALKAANPADPEWDDNRLFNVARLINAAVMAKIHTVEWTPAILPNHGLSMGLNANWYGVLTNLRRYGKDRRTLASINVRNPELGGVVGNPVDKHGEPYGLTEEFVEVYRLHSLLPEALELRRIDGGDAIDTVPLPETRQAGSVKLTDRHEMSDLFYSFGNMHPGALVLNNFPRFMQELSVPGNAFLDMAAVDILRARERGVPRYNEFRRQLQLNPIHTFDDLTDDVEVVCTLKSLYGDRPEDVERLDLMIGTLAEQHRPTAFGFGETLFQIFILNATRRLQADRFYTDSYTEEVYTQTGLDWVDRADLKNVLLRHHPGLERTGLANIKNAFEPWDTDATLDPGRHPLRAFDKALGSDRWRGDAVASGA